MELVIFSTLFMSLLLFAHGILEEDKIAFCDRASSATEDEPIIVAASKTDYSGKFYIFEANKTWLYDAESEQVEKLFDLVEGMKQKAPGFEHKPIIRATGIRSCPNSDELSFKSRQFITEEKYYPYTDITNPETWGVDNAKERNKELSRKYGLDINDKILTVGTSCYFNGKIEMNYIYLFAPPNKYRACSSEIDANNKQQIKECKAPIPSGIFRPFGFEKSSMIEETSKIPNALAYDFGVNMTNQKAFFVMGDVVTYWSSDDGGPGDKRKTTVNEIFGCKSSSLVVIIVIIGALIVLAFVIAGVLVVVVVLKSRSNFYEGETVTVVPSSKVQKISK